MIIPQFSSEETLISNATQLKQNLNLNRELCDSKASSSLQLSPQVPTLVS